MGNNIETTHVRTITGDVKPMTVSGPGPMHNGQRLIVVQDESLRCYAARLTPSGFVIVDEPVRLFTGRRGER